MKKLIGLLLAVTLAAAGTFHFWEPYLWKTVLAGEEKTESITYEGLASEKDAEGVIRQNLQKDGQDYVLTDYTMTAAEAKVDTKEVQETRTVHSDTADAASILENADKTMQYDKDGYTGTLYLDATKIRLESTEQNAVTTLSFIFVSEPADMEAIDESQGTDASVQIYRAELTYVGTVSKLEQGSFSATAIYTTHREKDVEKLALVGFGILIPFLLGLFLGMPSPKRKVKENRPEEDESTEDESSSGKNGGGESVTEEAEPEPLYETKPEPIQEAVQEPEKPVERNRHRMRHSASMSNLPVEKGYVPSYLAYLDRTGSDTLEEGGEQ